MAELDTRQSSAMGMRTEQLTGRTQEVFFSAEESGNLTYPWAPQVDFEKRTEIDAENLTAREVNSRIRNLMEEGYGSITVLNPGAKHSLGVGVLSRLNLKFEGSLGYFGCGLLDGPNVVVTGRVGWSCAENMMAGTLVIEKNAVRLSAPLFVAVIWSAKAMLAVEPESTRRVARLSSVVAPALFRVS
ncbi:MAG: hypothetical protein CM1200mP20_07490 [Pseudomonadota bacterium]|nr:MAG: hypothetical protein CM1200mP20_07490 [Pseudomonadota bacterium]